MTLDKRALGSGVQEEAQLFVRRMKRAYTQSAIILLNTVVLFVLMSAAWSAVVVVRNRGRPSSNVTELLNRYGKERLLRGYPGRLEAEVLEMLRETWDEVSRNGAYEPLTQFKEAPFRGRYVNVDPAGFRLSTPQGPWPPDPANFNIFLFGGSTAFGYGVSDDETLSSAMQPLLSSASARPVLTYNFGRGSYFSTQELMLYYRLLTSGSVPQVAVFVDGLNDFSTPDGEPEYTANLKLLIEEHGWDDRRGGLRSVLNATRAVDAARWLRDALGHREEDHGPAPYDEAVLARVRDRWLTNRRLIEKLSDLFRVRPVFVWQPVPMYRYDYKSYHVLGDLGVEPGASDRGYPLMARLRAELERSGDFLWLADMQQDKRENLYVDECHYTAAFTKEIAARICGFLKQR